MNVSQVIEIAKEGVLEKLRRAPAFYGPHFVYGAHFAGGINRMSKEAPFPIYSDVDVFIAVKDASQMWKCCPRSKVLVQQQKLRYKGVLLHSLCCSLKKYNSPEVVLSDPFNAHNLAVESIISDPTGMLTKLQRSVAQGYSQRRWVKARCESLKGKISKAIDKMSQSDLSTKAYQGLFGAVVHLGEIIAVAHLKLPTIRRCLVLTKELLQSQGKLDLHEEILRLYGCAHIGCGQVESYFQECVKAFNRAVDVKRTCDYFDIHSDVRPYLVEGTQEMIDEGNHREAMLHIMSFHYLANDVIQKDAPEEEKSQYQAGFDCLLRGLGWRNNWQSRIQLAKSVKEKIFQLVDEIVENHPGIKEL